MFIENDDKGQVRVGGGGRTGGGGNVTASVGVNANANVNANGVDVVQGTSRDPRSRMDRPTGTYPRSRS